MKIVVISFALLAAAPLPAMERDFLPPQVVAVFLIKDTPVHKQCVGILSNDGRVAVDVFESQRETRNRARFTSHFSGGIEKKTSKRITRLTPVQAKQWYTRFVAAFPSMFVHRSVLES